MPVREMAARDWDRVADDYFAAVVSPFSAGVPRALLRALDAARTPERTVAADLGCGIGTLLPALADRFRRVLAIDFSAAMLARARTACRARRVTFHRADLADLAPFHERLDVAVTVNAVLTPDVERLDRIFDQLRRVLRPGGALVGVFPAMEPVLYQGFLIHERERRVHTAPRARARTERILERRKYDFVFGTYRAGARVQKFFYAFELGRRLREAGFRRIRLGRVAYRWGDAVGGYESFPGEPPMWDWLVRAERGA
ncbi:MAG TPA: methyltransferase domain-containing protein [Candidatus Binatia bacterium]|nr:methyltransferase domain-containing protein [Candidatus Binatia bacterium]